jgi:hypothetical protein
VKSRKAEIVRRVHALPALAYDEERALTSFSGLVLFQGLFQALGLAAQLRRCFAHLGGSRVYGLARIVHQLIVHVLLGFRRLRDRDYYAADPLVCRVLGVTKLADTATISRTLAGGDKRAVDKLRAVVRENTLRRAAAEHLPRVTLDFDGSIQSTTRHAEGTAVGYNKIRKGARSYYPLYCVLAQLGMFIDMHHRPGNVHDSNGAKEYIKACLTAVKERLGRVVLEARLDSAFFDERVLSMLEELKVEYAASLPFARFVGLRHLVDARVKWRRIDDDWSFFETTWRPKSWSALRRVIFARRRRKVRRKGPLQLDIFEPIDHEFEYKALVTNKTFSAAAAIKFLNGRGVQEAIYAEAKQFAALGYIPCKRLVANQLYTLSSMLAHNLSRELQLRARPTRRSCSPKRTALFPLATLGTIRDRLIRRAGRLTRPQGRFTLTVAASGPARDDFARILDHLRAA